MELKAQKGFKGQSFIAKHNVIGASEGSKNKVGDTVVLVVKLDDPSGMGVKKLKTYLCALMGIDKSASAADVEDQLTTVVDCSKVDEGEAAKYSKKAHAQPAKGTLIRCEAHNATSAKTGGVYTNYIWTTVPDDEQTAA